MSAWYAATVEPRPDAAWELYHENSRRGRNDGVAAPRAALPAPDYGGFPLLALGEASPPSLPPAAPSCAGAGPIPLGALAGLLAAAGRPLADADPVELFVCLLDVETLPRGLAWYDTAAQGLRLLRGGDIRPDVERTLVVPEVVRRSAALLFLAATLDAATARAGERGYRDALIAIGRHVATLAAAGTGAGLRLDDAVAFYDREVDALLFLDGLARSVLRVVAVGPAGG